MNSIDGSLSGNKIKSDIFNLFNHLTTSLTYIYYNFDGNKKVYFSNNENAPSVSSELNSKNYARLWWRGSNLEDWVLVDLPINNGLLHIGDESSNLNSYIVRCLFNVNNYNNEPIYVCYHKYIDELCYTATSN
jgi:hypothetical protein